MTKNSRKGASHSQCQEEGKGWTGTGVRKDESQHHLRWGDWTLFRTKPRFLLAGWAHPLTTSTQVLPRVEAELTLGWMVEKRLNVLEWTL